MRGLSVLYANHLEDLRDHVVDWMLQNPLDPLEQETILVQSNGVSQWLKLALAEQGIAMGLDITLPARAQWLLYRSMPEGEGFPRFSPYDTEYLVWWIMKLLPEMHGRHDFAPLQRFLDLPESTQSPGETLRRQHQLALRIADLFDQYQVYRADWLTEWLTDRLPKESGDLLGDKPAQEDNGDRRDPATLHRSWQRHLWRRIVESMPPALREMDRATIHKRFLRYLEEWSFPSSSYPGAEDLRPPGIPRRVIVFGISSMAEQFVEVLHGISRFSHVILCVHAPCRYFADRNHADPGSHPGSPPTQGNPLYTAWGAQGRDFLSLIGKTSPVEQELFRSPGTDTRLHQLQDDILEDRPGEPVTAEDDDSIVFHVAHSALREVEILHDQLLDAFDRDPTLRPRDVMVMVPEISRYAPLISAVFGAPDRADSRFIPFTISDQGTDETDPVLRAVDIILALPGSRVTLEEIITLLETEAVSRRFHLERGNVPRILELAREAGVRWGLDSDQRSRHGIPREIQQNT